MWSHLFHAFQKKHTICLLTVKVTLHSVATTCYWSFHLNFTIILQGSNICLYLIWKKQAMERSNIMLEGFRNTTCTKHIVWCPRALPPGLVILLLPLSNLNYLFTRKFPNHHPHPQSTTRHHSVLHQWSYVSGGQQPLFLLMQQQLHHLAYSKWLGNIWTRTSKEARIHLAVPLPMSPLNSQKYLFLWDKLLLKKPRT